VELTAATVVKNQKYFSFWFLVFGFLVFVFGRLGFYKVFKNLNLIFFLINLHVEMFSLHPH
jgi:hypothetical protein